MALAAQESKISVPQNHWECVHGGLGYPVASLATPSFLEGTAALNAAIVHRVWGRRYVPAAQRQPGRATFPSRA